MPDVDLSNALILHAKLIRSYALENRIAADTGFKVWPTTGDTIQSWELEGVIPPIIHNDKFEHYERELAKQPFDQVQLDYVDEDGRGGSVRLDSAEDVQKLEEVGEAEYLRIHNIKLYHESVEKRDRLNESFWSKQVGKAEKESIRKRNELLEACIGYVSTWMLENGYEDEIVKRDNWDRPADDFLDMKVDNSSSEKFQLRKGKPETRIYREVVWPTLAKQLKRVKILRFNDFKTAVQAADRGDLGRPVLEELLNSFKGFVYSGIEKGTYMRVKIDHDAKEIRWEDTRKKNK
ncbi:hypothetical protein ACFLZR_01280 [Candidatus Neomarinimicrobiota bacterium]